MLGLSTTFFFGLAFDFTSAWYLRGVLVDTRGTIVASERTPWTTATFSMGGIHDRGSPIFRYHYDYEVDGRTYRGSSYGPRVEAPKTGAVTIEYPSAHPAISRIQGMAPEIHLRGGKTPLFIVGTIILIAMVSVIGQTGSGTRRIRLLRNGRQAVARVVARDVLSRVSGREWCEITYEFLTDSGRKGRLTERPHYTDNTRPGDDRILLYDRYRLDNAWVLPNGAGSPIERSGGWPEGLAVLFVPVISAVCVAVSLYLELGVGSPF